MIATTDNVIIAGDDADTITRKTGQVLDELSTRLNKGEKADANYLIAVFFHEESQAPQVIPTLNRALVTTLGMLDDYGLELIDAGEWQPRIYLLDGKPSCCLQYEVTTCIKGAIDSMDGAELWRGKMKDMLKKAGKVDIKR